MPMPVLPSIFAAMTGTAPNDASISNATTKENIRNLNFIFSMHPIMSSDSVRGQQPFMPAPRKGESSRRLYSKAAAKFRMSVSKISYRDASSPESVSFISALYSSSLSD